MSEIQYDESGELHITGITEARCMPKDDLDVVITVCQESIRDNVPSETPYTHYCMSDGPDNQYGGSSEYDMFEDAAHDTFEALAHDMTVLIHCHRGMSRSVSVAVAALARLTGYSVYEALEMIHRYRITEHDPDELLMEHAKRYVEQHSYSDDS